MDHLKTTLFLFAAICVLACGSRDGQAQIMATEDWSVSVQGKVIDSETNQPIAGALVSVDGDPPISQLNHLKNSPVNNRGQEQITGSDGRFKFSKLDLDHHFFYIAKQGYTTATNGNIEYSSYEFQPGHGMKDLRFFLTPTSELAGQVVTNSGQTMKGVSLTLYRELVTDGRGVWQQTKQSSTDAHGSYSFKDLKAGTYVVISGWVIDNDPRPSPGAVCHSSSFMPESGYAPAAIPGVVDFSSAVPVRLKPGQRAVANLLLEHQVFHPVVLKVGDAKPLGFSTLRDRNGRSLQMLPPQGSHCGWAMPVHYDSVTRQSTINLPDGSYTLQIHGGYSKSEGVGKYDSLWLANSMRFTVSGKPLTISSAPERSKPAPATQIHIHFDLTDSKSLCDRIVTSVVVPSRPDPNASPSRHVLWLSRADPLPEYSKPIGEMRRAGIPDDSTEFTYPEPGSYWVHAVEPGNTSWMTEAPNTYVAAITAGGVDMSLEPLVVGLDGTSPPLEVTLRNNCSAVHLKYLSQNESGDPVGIKHDFYGLLVPQFAGFIGMHSFLFESGRGQDISIGDLAPGHYKFYVVRQERGVAFRDPLGTSTALGTGQDIWLKPGDKAELSVTEPPDE
jgi:hypothetical protein